MSDRQQAIDAFLGATAPAGADAALVIEAQGAVRAWAVGRGKGAVARRRAAEGALAALHKHLNVPGHTSALLSACLAIGAHVRVGTGSLAVRRTR